ncbi:ABC transporter B family member 4-like isoform X1 [Nicotiana tomentosiformis]|uniref:ABC transporter B family member 4-like isoform X1 n=1 Tax=Nicotiana tomentosiformis TaxID=4098 RepID=UPI00051C1919|nr:ABC transporter B family member 4-like isoform X1 [Nicotiana tomentosiformis]XP_009630703.1 ABC transporter B family member 4-like isoform X2 [Nicotiana tomentosiformis]XP_018621864.1 ABC transporter B family member 4-like isoform X1 [Nicotiana tomentosiformis]
MAEENSIETGIDNRETRVLESSEGSTFTRESDKTKKQKEAAAAAEEVPYYKLFAFADTIDHALMVIGMITAVGSGICFPLMAVFFGEIVDSFGMTVDNGKIVSKVSKVALKFMYLAFGSGLATFTQVSCWTVTSERQAARIRYLYLRTVLRQDIGFFDQKTNTGVIIESLCSDTLTIQDAIGEKVGKFIQVSATFFGGFVIAFIKGWRLSLVMLSSVPPLVISSAVLTILLAKLASRAQTHYSEAATVVEQTISSIKTVASYTGERRAISEYQSSLNKAYHSGVQEGLASGLGFGVFMFVFYTSYALAIWYGAKMILDHNYTGGDVMNVIMATLTGSFSLGYASPCLRAFAAGKAAAFKMFETINRKPAIDPYDMNGQKLHDISGDIELKDIYFCYPARPQESIFSGFSLSIPKGTTTALVGRSGSGKSTVISLIVRFYDPQAGEVLIDSINIKEFQLRWIRGKIGLVSQEPVLFGSTIKDNIAYGKDDATLAEIKAAVQLANASKFIDNLPQGLDTRVGDHGSQLSGGQKQRIAIARAILKDPKILLLDEATSALDAESERIVQETLDNVMINRTTVIVAHRLSTVKNADTIAVIQEGKIIEKGSHKELLQNREGAYVQLIQLQELSKYSGEQDSNELDKEEIVLTPEKKPNKQNILTRSVSGGSFRIENSSHHSLSIPVSAAEKEVRECHDLNSTTAVLKKGKDNALCRLAFMNKPEIPELLLGCIAAVVNAIILPIFGVLLSNVIKTFYEPAHELRKHSRFWSLIFVGLGLASLLATPLRTFLFAVAGCKLIKRIRLMCFEKVVYMDISWFDRKENSIGAIGTRLSTDAASVRGMVGESLALVVQNTSTAIAGLVIGLEASWQLALIMIVMVPLIGLNGYLHMKYVSGFGADAKKLYEDASRVASEAVGSIRTVASFSAEEKVVQLYKRKCEEPVRAGIKEGLLSGAGFGFSMFCLYSVYAASFYAGARLIESGKVTFAEVFRVFYGLSLTATAISQSGGLAPDSTKAKSGASSIFALLDRQSKIDSSDNSGMILDNVKGNIEFQHVSFNYPSRPEAQVLKDLCLIISSGETVALVGESGSGKSTVISLLQRFYDPDSGLITLDGIEIQKLKVKWLRQQMGLVSQEPILFNDTIRANIAYGKEGDATEAEILAAAELANAHNFISGLQQGYDTLVGERGIQLSGGQKQRVAIARAIVKCPKILLLDEATSALDSESEKVVQDALDRVREGRTTVVVAHRLSTIKGADVIAVMKDGAIVEKGNHETLVNREDGIYASLVSKSTSTMK